MLPLLVAPNSPADWLVAGPCALPFFWDDILLPNIHPPDRRCILPDAHSFYNCWGNFGKCTRWPHHTHRCNNSSSCCTISFCWIGILHGLMPLLLLRALGLFLHMVRFRLGICHRSLFYSCYHRWVVIPGHAGHHGTRSRIPLR